MQYRQDSWLKSNQMKRTAQSGEKIKQIVFEKQITQQWKVHTNEPTQLLPYAIKHMGLSSMCEFWHQLKFFYFENYEENQNTQQTIQDTNNQKDQQQYEEESIILIKHSSQRIQQCKRFIKSLWKITRQRLIISMTKMKLEAGLQDQSSLQLQDEKLNSYMRFLKLQENKRIDIAIENLDSVVQKNSRKKVLNAFLNMRQILKSQRKAQNYRDRIKIQCFIDIVMRSVRKINHYSLSDAFSQCHQYTRHVKLKRQLSQLSARRRQNQKKLSTKYNRQELTPKPNKITNSNQISSFKLNPTTNQKSTHKTIINQRSISNNKLLTPQLGQYKKDTIQRMNMMMSRQDYSHRKNQMQQMSTVKRKQPVQRVYEDEDILLNSNIQSIESQLQVVQSGQKVIESQYYYEDSYKNQQQQEEQLLQQYNNVNTNGLPTRRTSNHSGQYNIKNNFKPLEQVNSQIIHKKTARTPNRSHSRQASHQHHLNHNSYLSQQLLNNNFIDTNNHYQQQHQHNHTNSQHSSIKNIELHIPITQRFEKNYYHQEHYQEEEEQSEAPSANNIHQQICVIRNTSATPQRTPDRYQKIPIVSNNIEFRQFFVNSNKKKYTQHHVDLHSSSFYQRQCADDCQYCTRLKKVNQMMQEISARKSRLQRQTIQINRKNVNVIKESQTFNNTKEITQTTTIEEKIIQQTQQIQKSQTIANNQTQIIDKKQQPNLKLKLKNNSQTENNSNHQLIKKPTNIQAGQNAKKSHEKEETQTKNSQVQKQSTVRQNSRTMLAPSRQSVFSEKSKGPSKGKMFTRKPMY